MISLNFVYMAGITSDLAKKSIDPLRRSPGGSLDNFCRENIAGKHSIEIFSFIFGANEDFA